MAHNWSAGRRQGVLRREESLSAAEEKAVRRAHAAYEAGEYTEECPAPYQYPSSDPARRTCREPDDEFFITEHDIVCCRPTERVLEVAQQITNIRDADWLLRQHYRDVVGSAQPSLPKGEGAKAERTAQVLRLLKAADRQRKLEVLARDLEEHTTRRLEDERKRRQAAVQAKKEQKGRADVEPASPQGRKRPREEKNAPRSPSAERKRPRPAAEPPMEEILAAHERVRRRELKTDECGLEGEYLSDDPATRACRNGDAYYLTEPNHLVCCREGVRPFVAPPRPASPRRPSAPRPPSPRPVSAPRRSTEPLGERIQGLKDQLLRNKSDAIWFVYKFWDSVHPGQSPPTSHRELTRPENREKLNQLATDLLNDMTRELSPAQMEDVLGTFAQYKRPKKTAAVPSGAEERKEQKEEKKHAPESKEPKKPSKGEAKAVETKSKGKVMSQSELLKQLQRIGQLSAERREVERKLAPIELHVLIPAVHDFEQKSGLANVDRQLAISKALRELGEGEGKASALTKANQIIGVFALEQKGSAASKAEFAAVDVWAKKVRREIKSQQAALLSGDEKADDLVRTSEAKIQALTAQAKRAVDELRDKVTEPLRRKYHYGEGRDRFNQLTEQLEEAKTQVAERYSEPRLVEFENQLRKDRPSAQDLRRLYAGLVKERDQVGADHDRLEQQYIDRLKSLQKVDQLEDLKFAQQVSGRSTVDVDYQLRFAKKTTPSIAEVQEWQSTNQEPLRVQLELLNREIESLGNYAREVDPWPPVLDFEETKLPSLSTAPEFKRVNDRLTAQELRLLQGKKTDKTVRELFVVREEGKALENYLEDMLGGDESGEAEEEENEEQEGELEEEVAEEVEQDEKEREEEEKEAKLPANLREIAQLARQQRLAEEEAAEEAKQLEAQLQSVQDAEKELEYIDKTPTATLREEAQSGADRRNQLLEKFDQEEGEWSQTIAAEASPEQLRALSIWTESEAPPASESALRARSVVLLEALRSSKPKQWYRIWSRWMAEQEAPEEQGQEPEEPEGEYEPRAGRGESEEDGSENEQDD